MSLDWEAVAAMALALPGTELSTHYGRPAVKANGRAVLGAGDTPGSFVLHVDGDSKQVLLDTGAPAFWQTPHYDGWPALLVRYDIRDVARLEAVVARAVEQARARRRR